jgi:oxygen-independent coproporphyrinogen-3 oxidase
MLGLYVHIPFCSAICNYCNFNRGLFEPRLKDRYLAALLTEIGGAPTAPGPGFPAEAAGQVAADSLFFGGGTPSLLQPAEVSAIINACREAFDLQRSAEITLEANPESVSPSALAGYREAGVNRLSFGVQSFRDDELVRLSRLHGVSRAKAAYAEARAAGFDNVSLELMMWLPGQRVADWLTSVETAAALNPDHLSLYLLEIYPNAPLREEMARAKWSQAADDDAAAMYLEAMERLDRAGFSQYEISNVAKPGRESRHNLKYWRDGCWRGFGCGAHSTRDGIRWKNVSAIDDYIDRVTAAESFVTDIRRLTPDERLGDALFTGLRLTEGVAVDGFRGRYGVDVWAKYARELQPFIEEGLLQRANGRLQLTRRGMLLAHEVMAVFV